MFNSFSQGASSVQSETGRHNEIENGLKSVSSSLSFSFIVGTYNF